MPILHLAAMGILCQSMFNNSWCTCTDTSGKSNAGQGAVINCDGALLLWTGMHVQHEPAPYRLLRCCECTTQLRSCPLYLCPALQCES